VLDRASIVLFPQDAVINASGMTVSLLGRVLEFRTFPADFDHFIIVALGAVVGSDCLEGKRVLRHQGEGTLVKLLGGAWLAITISYDGNMGGRRQPLNIGIASGVIALARASHWLLNNCG